MRTYLAHKNQIQGFKDVSETVKTVEKIAASSVHFLKRKVSNLSIYATGIERTLARLSLFYQNKNHPLLRNSGEGEKALIILTGDKGLTGGLWHRVVNEFLENFKRRRFQFVITIGVKGENYLHEENMPVMKSFSRFSDIPSEEEIARVTDYIFYEFEKGTFAQVDILYPRFVSLAEQRPFLVPFLPFKFTGGYSGQKIQSPKEFKPATEKERGAGLPIFEPSKKKIFSRLLQKYIGIFFHKIIMETKLSEFSARTVAMEHAAVKTEELIRKFALDYMKERHRVVTQRQLESFAAHKIIP